MFLSSVAYAGINWWSVLAAAVAAFAFGGFWYAWWSSTWLNATGISFEERDGMPVSAHVRAYGVTLLSEAVMAAFLAGVMAHFASSGITVRTGLITGALVWLGFVLTVMATATAHTRKPLALLAVDGGHWLGVLLIEGAILGALAHG